MAQKLTSRQQAQMLYLQSIAPKMDRIKAGIEQMATLKMDDTAVRGLIRMMAEMKIQAQTLSLTDLADNLGHMAMLARRGGGLQVKVRGLRELFVGLKVNYEGALRAATTEMDSSGQQEEGTKAGQ